MPSPSERPETAALFDSALTQCRRSFGSRERPEHITIVTCTGLTCTLDVPNWWEIEVTADGQPKLPNPGAIADILHLLVEIGHRLTRDEVIAELTRRKKKRAEGIVGDTLSLLVKLGVLDNRQDSEFKGYGLKEFD